MFENSFTAAIPPVKLLINVKAITTESKNFLAYEQKEELARLCREGCPDYNTSWSCPPHSPAFSHFAESYPYALLVLYHCSMDQFDHVESSKRMRASNTSLRLTLEKHLRSLENYHHGRMLSSGICRLCTRCSCADKAGPCRRPKEMRYSMESLGLNVAQITEDFLNHSLAWNKEGSLPQYSSSVACLLAKHPVDAGELAYLP
jgi:predicted metal-binding protein